MRLRLPIKQRIVSRIVRSVNSMQAIEALRALQLKYGIPSTLVDTRSLPLCDVSERRRRCRHSKRLVCGGARENYTFILFEPGLHARAHRGFGLKLTVLETIFHEMTHNIAELIVVKGVSTDSISSDEYTRKLNGFHETRIVDGEPPTVCNELFNEGVVQLFASEWMREYLTLGTFMDVTESECKKYFQQVVRKKIGSFYPDATALVRAFVCRIADVMGSKKVVYDKLFQDYFASTSLQNSATWLMLMRAAQIDQIMLSVRVSEYESLRIHEAHLRKTRGVWDEITEQ